MSDEEKLTAAVIAKELGVSDAKVKKAIESLKLEPVAKRGICKFYGRDALDAIRQALK